MTLKVKCDQLIEGKIKLSICSGWQDECSRVSYKYLSDSVTGGSPFRLNYNLPIFVNLMPLLSSRKQTNAARQENYSVKRGRMEVRFCTLNNFIGSGIIDVFVIFQGDLSENR